MKRLSRIGRNSIKESFDNLPAGLCCFNKRGLPVLVNHTMDRIAFELMGHDLQFEKELETAVAGLKDHIFPSESGTVWKFSCRKRREFGSEYIAADITSLYRNTKLLQEKNRQLKEMNAAIEEIGRNYTAIAREEEILSMKMRIHSEMGRCGLHIRKYVQEGYPADRKQELIREIRQTASLLRGKGRSIEQEDSLAELMRTARAIGAEIKFSGRIPQEEKILRILIPVLRECLMNAIRHAGGTVLYAAVQRNDRGYTAEITNNGKLPEGKITEGGGLSSLRKKLERAGCTMEISHTPRFCLTVFLPE